MQLHENGRDSLRPSTETGSLGADDRHKIGWIEEVLEEDRPGIFRLYTSKYKSYSPRYIVRFREREDVMGDILHFARRRKYDYFALEHMTSQEEVFKRLCGLWHYYRDELDNENHPRRPEGMEAEVSCPQCNDRQYELF
ncbi:hypothetical protein [Salinibacter grassmerensis]|uniref:hypothetical protein n=1 Tax=Salinibacter grassmerensis TaxID=3040353 RepID=UPI0021E7B6B6|nr:hypothetical protein [Salinibacter grassmerensis]